MIRVELTPDELRVITTALDVWADLTRDLGDGDPRDIGTAVNTADYLRTEAGWEA